MWHRTSEIIPPLHEQVYIKKNTESEPVLKMLIDTDVYSGRGGCRDDVFEFWCRPDSDINRTLPGGDKGIDDSGCCEQNVDVKPKKSERQ